MPSTIFFKALASRLPLQKSKRRIKILFCISFISQHLIYALLSVLNRTVKWGAGDRSAAILLNWATNLYHMRDQQACSEIYSLMITLSVTFPGFIFLQSELGEEECHFETIFIQYAGPRLFPNTLYGSISVRRFIELSTIFQHCLWDWVLEQCLCTILRLHETLHSFSPPISLSGSLACK